MKTLKKIIVPKEEEGQRLDVWLSRYVESRSFAEKIIKQKKIRKQTSTQKTSLSLKPSLKIKAGERYVLSLPKKSLEEKDWTPYNYPISIIFEDKDLLVINKPAGMVVHPGPGHKQNTLIHALVGKTTLSPGGDPLRPGIVHRLDKDVSGLMLLSKTKTAEELLIKQFKAKKIKRIYRALVCGKIKKEKARIESFIGRHPKDRKKFYSFDKETTGRKKAVTYYQVVESFEEQVHQIECRLETGRTHQIRVHLSSLGIPILGDKVYFRRQKKVLEKLKNHPLFKNTEFKTPALYSAYLAFTHPINKKPFSFSLPWPFSLKGKIKGIKENQKTL